HQARQKTLSEARARAEIQRQRIRPHFLFNSMNIIASLTQRAPARAESAIEDMADLFRLMLDENKELMPVHHEVQVARKYVKLEKLRLDERLNVEWHSEKVPRTAKTPVLMLQLLLENVIRQGIEARPEGGRIDIQLGVDEGILTVEVSAPEPPGESDVDDPERDTALENVRLRLSDYYGEAGKLYIERKAGRFVFRVQHPAFGES
ncbi:MAG: histidine kinase, partial [Gammaproteobacteria bacterium]|nr:histidine kinase [Gammaproteobacteria bacterium]